MVATFNKASRLVPVWLIYALGALPVMYLAVQTLQGQLGADPVRRIEHSLGLWGFQLLLVTLSITPLMKLFRLNLMRFRRALGVLAGLYIVLHFTAWLLLDLQLRWGEIWADLTKRPYIIVGMVALVFTVPLLVTSNNRAVRKLGALRWKRLHWLTYAIVALGMAHYVMQEKVWSFELIGYTFLTCLLLSYRVGQFLPKKAYSLY